MRDVHNDRSGSYLEKVFIKQRGKIIPIKTGSIFYIKAKGNYLEIHLSEESYLIRSSLNDIQNKLDPSIFFRIHRSHIVNLDKIKFIETLDQGGDCEVQLINNEKLRLSRRYKNILKMYSIND